MFVLVNGINGVVTYQVADFVSRIGEVTGMVNGIMDA